MVAATVDGIDVFQKAKGAKEMKILFYLDIIFAETEHVGVLYLYHPIKIGRAHV